MTQKWRSSGRSWPAVSDLEKRGNLLNTRRNANLVLRSGHGPSVLAVGHLLGADTGGLGVEMGPAEGVWVTDGVQD